MALAVALPAAAGRRTACPKRSSRSRRSRSSRSTRRSPAARVVQVMPQPDFAFPLDEVLAAITPQHARRLPDEPEQSDRRRRCRSTRSGTIARRVPHEADRLRRRGVRRVRRRDVHPRARARSRTSIVGRTFSKAFGLAGLRIGCLVGAPDTLDPIRLRDAGLQRQHRGRRRACRRRSAISTYLQRLPAAGRTSRRRCSTPRAIGSG